ncbi:MAG: 50S ribosomal protein L13 [Candidatus Parcubacteria bacterium]|nr:MAG: 50S ribosomal protein L13 [Candidatus Parcubacteria bacterium]
MKEEVIIDAKNKSLGRLATLISYYLQGKHRVDYAPYKDEKIYVVLKNLDQAKFTGKKLIQDYFTKHTGYIGHLKELALKDLWAKDKLKVMRLIVSKMLPKNKLRNNRLLRIKLDDNRNKDNN